MRNIVNAGKFYRDSPFSEAKTTFIYASQVLVEVIQIDNSHFFGRTVRAFVAQSRTKCYSHRCDAILESS